MGLRAILIYGIFLLCGSYSLSAQVPPRAQKYFDEAHRQMMKHQPQKADVAMRLAIKEYPAFTEAYSTLGQWLFDQHDYGAATQIFLQAERACPKGDVLFAKAIARSMVYSGNYVQALQRIPYGSKDPEWKQLSMQARFMQKAASSKVIQKVEPMGDYLRINTKDPELFPVLSADGSTFFFTRRVNRMDEDIYYAKRDSCGGWLAAKNMGLPPNSPDHESAQSLSADRHYLFMMRCDNRSENGWSQGGCDLYMAYTADSLWSIPLSFGATINTPAYEGMPSLSGDNRELFFVSDREGGYGGKDIWSSRFEHGLWQLPRNLGPAINTSNDETAPFIYADNQTLYFASKGHEGMGGNDLFISRRINDTTWGKPINLGWPINSRGDDISLNLDAMADTAYFASDRDSAGGSFDIYKVALLPAQKPIPITFFKGFVKDSIGQTSLNYANIYFTDSATGNEDFHVVSNRGDGSYTIALPVGHTYAIMLSRIGFSPMFDTIRAVKTESLEPTIHNFSILPADYEKPTTDTLVARINFRKNVLVLNDSEKVVLAEVMRPWLNQTEISVMINGYTDNSGTPMLNEQFSSARASGVTNLLKDMGFPGERLQSQGWGEANTLVENDSEENRDKNRRVEIIIRK